MTTAADPAAVAPPSPPSPTPAAATRRRADSRQNGRPSSLGRLARLISPLVLVGLWQLASQTGFLPEKKLAAPSTILSTAADLVREGTLGSQTLISVQRVAIGLVIGLAVGLVLALLAGLSQVLDLAIDPPMQALRTLPHLGLVPLFIIWFGLGEEPKLFLIALGVTFPIYLNPLAGIRGIDRKVLEAADSMGLTRLQQVRYVVLPGALPSALTGLRQSLGVAWLTLVVAETIAADSGLGYMINQAREFGFTDVVVVGLAVYSILGLLTDAVVRSIERRALAWRS